MNKNKKEALKETYQNFTHIGLTSNNLERLDTLAISNIMGFGSTFDEKIFSLAELRELLVRQKEQVKDLSMNWDIKPLYRHIAEDGNTAVFADEVRLHFTTAGEIVEMYLRFSIVLEYCDGHWKVIHWHGSKPENVRSAEDSWGVETWKKKTEALEKLVAEKTADLIVKNRKLEIEVALERVRARTMAMKHSDELTEASRLLDEQVRALGIETWGCAFHIYADDPEGDYEWFSSREGTLPFYKTPRENFFLRFFEKGKARETFHVEEFLGADCIAHYEYLMTIPVMGDALRSVVASGASLPESQYDHIAFFKHGYILFITYEPVPKSHAVFQRFSKVFEQTYTRFLDLQKAEAQAREAKIETALEKVRSRTMGMQNSDELPEVANLLFLEVQALGIPAWSCGYCILLEDKKSSTCIMSSEGTLQKPFLLPHYGEVSFEEWDEFVNGEATFLTQELGGKAIESHYAFMKSLPQLTPIFQEIEDVGLSLPTYQINHLCKFNQGFLLFITYEKVPDAHDIFKRFTKVFDQTYTRFLDLQKAEAQAREAKIEVALEKVRSRTMGMQKSDELADVANVLFQEMNNLVNNLWTCGFVLCEKNREEDEWWLSLEDGFSRGFFLPNVNDYAHSHLYEGWLKKEDFRTVQLEGDKLQDHYDWLMQIPIGKSIFDEMEAAGMQRPEWQKLHAAYFSKGYLVIITREPCPEEAIFKRFAQVFDLTFTRFLDLKKAEAQAIEAQIELSLERIRAQVTGMQESSELLDIVVTMRTEFVKLDHEAHYFWHMRWLPDTYEKAMTSGDGTKIGMVMTLPRHIHGDIKQVAQWEKSKEPIHVLAMDADAAVDYVDKMISLGDFEQVDPQAPSLEYIRHIGGLTFVMARTTHGEIGYSLPGVVTNPSKEAVDTLVRFSGVFDLAYRRFEDLKKAEAQARENQIELALEKVRSRTMTMEHSSELAETSVVVFKELLNLGIAPNRLFIGIIKDNGNAIEAWATDEDGSKIEKHFQLYPSENISIKKMVDAWRQEQKSTIIDMEGQELKDYFHYLNKVMHIPFIHGLKQKRRVQTIAYFSGGLIGMAAPEEQPQETVVLLERFAAVFNLTYTRFNDLKIAEAQALQAEKDLIEIKQARQKAEAALIELKATQSQLVQQEKLASLGQLTAGIAHEIKNPLNFVNNFSEVSMELIGEIKEERAKSQESRDETLVDEILEDIQSNLTKIHEHGTRANSIVSSMLQHSRGGSGKMEPTDLNALIKEYTNLSFHGMRAKKNPINVEIDLQLDPNIKAVSLIGEDFSRVILNLTNNAFDAMRKTAELRPAKLTVRTKQETNAIVIEVEDNGPGIPDDIRDKILQPFFTNKKGTEGTGLGLSITNDIIKAHAGRLLIASKTGQTLFQIYLNV